MSNHYFQFKKFTVQQDKCSMKVCTDSCLFGAWVASLIEKNKIKPGTILDIGTGTGLLSLMLAQKTNVGIDAVEIDTKAFEQAKQNILFSPWKDQIKIFNADIKKWNAPSRYNLIISNPPFYESDLLPEDDRKNISKHSGALNLEELLATALNSLTDNGLLAVLIPWRRTTAFENIASQYSLQVKEKIAVKQTPSHDYFRTMLLLQNQQTPKMQNEIMIKNSSGDYSDEFKFLLKDYYLYL